MSLAVAVSGLKHDHVRPVLTALLASPGLRLVGVADDDPANRLTFERDFGITVAYASHRELLESLEFDVMVVCEAFGRRGAVVLDALRGGKHVFSDKPLCTSEEELWQIAAAARAGDREIGLDLSFRHWWARTGPPLQQGEIGRIVGCVFSGPHGLHCGSRPQWYFQPGLHGGIINDLIGHGVDYVRWVTGHRATQVLSASVARVGVPQAPDFQTLGEAHLLCEGGATAFGQVSYLVPEGHGAGWQFALTGTEGDAFVDEQGLRLRRAGRPERRIEPGAPEPRWEHPFTDFAHYLTDGEQPLRTTTEVLECSLATLTAQCAADTGKTRVPIPPMPG